MNKWTRTFSCLLLILAMTISVTACGGTKDSEKQTKSTATPETTEKAEEAPLSDVEGAALKDLYAPYFKMGAAINGSDKSTAAIHHEGMAEVLKKHYNSTSLSNLMKPVYLLDEKSCKKAGKKEKNAVEVSVNFDSCKESLDFCKENGIQMRGHTLVWHNQTPEWFFKENYDESKDYVSKEVMAQRMENYIKQVMDYCQTNYPGVVYCWDVVNESVDDVNSGSSDMKDGWACRTTFNGSDNFWYATMGTDYVYKAFEYARKYADEDVKLYYNDYNVFQTRKAESICALMKKLQKDNLIDGIGLQPTVNLYYPDELAGDAEDSFESCLKTYSELGLEIQITELSFMIDEESMTRDETTLKRQADRYQEMFELLVRMDSDNGGPCNITSVTVFGICDDYPLYDNHVQCLYLWDKECQPKEAFFRIREVGESLAK